MKKRIMFQNAQDELEHRWTEYILIRTLIRRDWLNLICSWMLEDKDFSSFLMSRNLNMQLDTPNVCFFLPSQMSRLIYFNESFE